MSLRTRSRPRANRVLIRVANAPTLLVQFLKQLRESRRSIVANSLLLSTISLRPTWSVGLSGCC
ncbi:hypothetical protein I3842_15G040200 [Carya illinoinensis]|uniref:Uncharacterized protein n=1 Tax=Carya illinoinensis TaxID=32201 RepID=A0A922D6B7_CARIL|nr:hypothetical protein I3842_15G040200 [Carya illinoinensis]